MPKEVGISRIYADESQIFLCSEKSMFYSTVIDPVPYWESEMLLEKDVEVSNVFPGENGSYFTSYGNGIFHKIPGTSVLIPIHNTLQDKSVRTMLETSEGSLLVGCESGMYKSTDGGKNWKQVLAGTGINSFAKTNGILICGTYDGILRSTDDGEHWDNVLSQEGSAYQTGYFEGHFVTITQGGDWQDHPKNRMYISSDGAKTWQRIDQGLSSGLYIFNREPGTTSIVNINDIKKAGQYLFCSCDAGVFRSSDWGKTWEPVFTPEGMKQLQLGVSGEVIYAVKVIGC